MKRTIDMFFKIMSVVLLVLGALVVILDLVAITQHAGFDDKIFKGMETSQIMIYYAVATASGVFEFLAGLFGLQAINQKKNYKLCLIMSALLFVSVILTNAVLVTYWHSALDIFKGLLVYILYIVIAILYKKYNPEVA